jgi:hypothetical protein
LSGDEHLEEIAIQEQICQGEVDATQWSAGD